MLGALVLVGGPRWVRDSDRAVTRLGSWKTNGRLPAGGLSADSTPTGLGLPSPAPIPMHRQESIRRLLISAGQGGVVVTPSVTPSTNNPHCFLR